MADIIYIVIVALIAALLVGAWVKVRSAESTPSKLGEISLGYQALMVPTQDGDAEYEQYLSGRDVHVVSLDEPLVVRVEHPVQVGQRAYCRIQPSAQGSRVGLFRADADDGCAVPCGRFVPLTAEQRLAMELVPGDPLVAGLLLEPQELTP